VTDHHPYDELAVYALDALDDDERLVVEAHLARCPACTTIVDEHRATLAALTTDEPPPPAVWQRIAAQTGAGDVPTPLAVMPSAPAVPAPPAAGPGSPRREAGPGAAGPAGPAPTHLRPRRSAPPRRWAAITGIAAAAALVVGGVAGVALADRDDEPADLAELAAAALEQPGASVATLAATDDGRDAARVVTDGSTGYIVLDDLPALPAGQAYQLWRLADGTDPVSLGVIGDGREEVATVGVPSGTSMLALSVEPADGSVAPSSEVVASGAFA
jgi:anti-sigma-K factor RskA